jgi:hypothetical protein
VLDGSIADSIVERFLGELERSLPEGKDTADGIRRLLDRGLMGREDALIELCERLVSERP